jgi:tetratricopeptide (TPR) repeat protein
MLKQLVRTLFSSEKRSWTVEEVRDLIFGGDLERAQQAAGQLHAVTPRRDLTRDCILAEIAFRQERDADAENGFRAVLKDAPGFADAHFGLSLLLLEQGETEAAIEHAQFAKNMNPTDARYLAQLGLCQITVGNFSNAESPLSLAVRLNEKDKASWNNLGLVLLAKSELAEAHACFSKALKLDPNFGLALQNLVRLESEIKTAGALFMERPRTLAHASNEPQSEELAPWEKLWVEVDALKKNQPNLALARAESICFDWSEIPGPVCKLDELYRKLGDSQGGVDALHAYLVLHPKDGEALAALGSGLITLGEHARAEQYLEQARLEGFENARVLSELAQALNNQEKHIEAIEHRRMAVELDSGFKYKAQLAVSLVTACLYDQAIELIEELLKEDPERENLFLVYYAVAQAYVGRFDEALALLDKAINNQPHDATLHLQRAQINLLRGDFSLGWKDYAYRGLAYAKNYRVLPFTKWQGENLHNKCIVVLAEQGLGDQVMLASCLPDLFARGPDRVVLEVIARVAPTLARSFPECEIMPTRQDKEMEWAKSVGHVDYYVPLGDLPQYFRTDLKAFPGKPYLKPDLQRVKYWREKLAAAGPQPWIGVSWRGGLQATRQVLRSMSTCDLASLGGAIDATWISLQYGSVTDDLAIAELSNFPLIHWPQAIADLDEFAALIEALDCVVTVCNTTVHYAGALGKKVIVLAPHIPEWRYGLTNSHMPWYADVTVLRQARLNDWTSVVQDAGDRLSDITWPWVTNLSSARYKNQIDRTEEP